MITALLAVGVLAAAGTDCTHEALPGESPFTKARTIASLALLAAAAPNSLIGGGVSAPVTASANSGPALIGVTFAFNAVSGGAVSAGAVTQNGGNGADGAAAAPNSLIGGGSIPTAAALDLPSRLSATRRPFSAAPAAEADLRGATAAQAAQAALRNQRKRTLAPAVTAATRTRPSTAAPGGNGGSPDDAGDPGKSGGDA